MYTYPIKFKQTRTSIIKGGFWLVGVYIIAYILYAIKEDNFSAMAYVIVSSLIAVVIFYATPLAQLELHKDKFIFKQGNKKIVAKWSTVTNIGFQSSNNNTRPKSFFIITENQKTPLINYYTLVRIGGEQIEKIQFAQILHELSDVEVLIDDYHIHQGHKGSKKIIAIVLALIGMGCLIFMTLLQRPEKYSLNQFIDIDLMVTVAIAAIIMIIVKIIRKK